MHAGPTEYFHPPEKRLLNASQTAQYLGVKEQTVRQWASMGKLPKVKLRGKSLRFDIVELDRIIDQDGIPPRSRD